MTEEAAYLDKLRGLWRANWPKDIPQQPVFRSASGCLRTT